jgi:hypothetical protein
VSQPSGIVCSVCGRLFCEPVSFAAAVSLRDALLSRPPIAPAPPPEKPAARNGDMCRQCYGNLLQWARHFELREVGE